MDLGPELVTNGDFADDTVWAKDGTASIEVGVAKLLTVNDAVVQTISITEGNRYRVTVDIVSVVAPGDFLIYLGGTSLVQSTAEQSFSHDIICGSLDALIVFMSDTVDSNFHIDNVSVKQIFGGMAIPGPEFMDEMESW